MVNNPPANQMTIPQIRPSLIKLTSLHDFRHIWLWFCYQNIDFVGCLTQTNKISLVNPIKYNSFWSCIALFTEPFFLPFTPPLHSPTLGSFGSWPFKQLLWNPLLQHSQNTKSESFPTFPHIFDFESKNRFLLYKPLPSAAPTPLPSGTGARSPLPPIEVVSVYETPPTRN